MSHCLSLESSHPRKRASSLPETSLAWVAEPPHALQRHLWAPACANALKTDALLSYNPQTPRVRERPLDLSNGLPRPQLKSSLRAFQ